MRFVFYIGPVLLHHCSKAKFFSWKMDRNEIGEDNKQRRKRTIRMFKVKQNNESCVSFEKKYKGKEYIGKRLMFIKDIVGMVAGLMKLSFFHHQSCVY